MLDLKNVSILNILPPNLAADPNVKMAAMAFDEALREIISKIPGVSILTRIPELTDSSLLDLLAWQFHVDFYDAGMPVELKRVLVQRSLDWHLRKGTPSAVEEIVTATLADAKVTEWYEYGGEPGYFRVETEIPIQTEKEYEDMVAAIYSVKNTRSWLEFIMILINTAFSLYVGMAVWIEDIMIIGLPPEETEVDITEPARQYIGVLPDIGGVIEIFAGT